MDSKNFDRMTRGFAGTTSRRQALKLLGGGLIGGAVAGAGFGVARETAAQQGLAGLSVPVEGFIGDDPFAGFLNITNFFNDDGVLAVAGQIVDTAGTLLGSFTSNVTGTQQSCEILSLTLGPLDLDVLGLVITIPNPIVVTITAEQGPGNLLGNLLCAVAGLLDGGAPLNTIVRQLNRLLGLLG